MALIRNIEDCVGLSLSEVRGRYPDYNFVVYFTNVSYFIRDIHDPKRLVVVVSSGRKLPTLDYKASEEEKIRFIDTTLRSFGEDQFIIITIRQG